LEKKYLGFKTLIALLLEHPNMFFLVSRPSPHGIQHCQDSQFFDLLWRGPLANKINHQRRPLIVAGLTLETTSEKKQTNKQI